jgi:IS30 family transposase
MISRAMEAEVLRLHHAERWPIGTIARQLMLHHSTVRRVLAQAGVPAAQWSCLSLEIHRLLTPAFLYRW